MTRLNKLVVSFLWIRILVQIGTEKNITPTKLTRKKNLKEIVNGQNKIGNIRLKNLENFGKEKDNNLLSI